MDTTILGSLTGIIVLAAIFTMPIAFGLIWLYQHSVIRLMSKRSTTETLPTYEKVKPQTLPSEIKPQFVFPDATNIEKVTQIELLTKLRLRRWQAAVIYMLGGFCFAIISTISMLLADQTPVTLLRLLYLTWIFLFPTCFAVNLVSSTHWKAGFNVVMIYFSGWILLSIINIIISPKFNWAQAITLWAVIDLLPTILVSTFLFRRIRAVGPMVFTFLAFGFTGGWLLTQKLLEQGSKDSSSLIIAIMAKLFEYGLSADSIIVLVEATDFILVALVGWLALQLLKWLYLHKRQSDHSLTLDPILLAFAFINSATLFFHNPWWLLSGLIAFGVYKIVTWIGFAWLNHNRRKTNGVRLLILRVFSLGKRSDQLYSAIAKAWRYVGNLRFITGPDLATSTVEPHNFLDFVSGRLRHRFIDSAERLEHRIADADIFPDLDGRYRILDFFCYDNTWKMVLTRLAKDSDVILMDLRQFSEKHAGCIFEIHELTNNVLLDRVVFIIDKTTDKNFLRNSIEDFFKQLSIDSPNRDKDPIVHLFNYSGSKRGEFDQLLKALSVAAN